MFFGVAVGSAARRRRARTRSNTEVLSCGTTAHRARAEVAALIVQCWTNPHEKYHLFRSNGVEWMLKCRGNYFRLLRSPQHKRNVPEVVKKSVCSRDGLPTARPWPPRREQPTCEKLPLNNSCCYVRRAACFSPLTPRQSLDSLPRPPLFFSPLARTASLH